MSPALPVISGAQAVAGLRKAGFEHVSQGGSHVKLRAEDGRVVIVPMHRELAVGTLHRSSASRASVEEFLALL